MNFSMIPEHKGQLKSEKSANINRGTRKSESCLSTKISDIILSDSVDKGDDFFPSKNFISSKNKLAKHLT
jgi:hypothetical protein